MSEISGSKVTGTHVESIDDNGISEEEKNLKMKRLMILH